MGKGKNASGVQGRHNYSRASYLYQAATYLATQVQDSHAAPSLQQTSQVPPIQSERQKRALQNMSRQAITDMRAVTLKAQIRQNSDLKRMICKFCDTLQLEGKTSVSTVENPSKDGKKSWADVLVVQCKTCSNVKRYPISAPRQKRRSQRQDKTATASANEQKLQPPITAT